MGWVMLEVMGGEPGGAALTEQRRRVEVLFTERYGELVGLAALVTGDRSVGEDLVQDVFTALYRRTDPLDDPEAMVGFLRRSVVNASRDRLRRRAVERRPHPLRISAIARSTEQTVLDDDDAVAVAAAVARLPVRQRECIACRYTLGLTHPEIAATLGISAGSVKTHLHRATRTLARLLEDRR